jgi:hypothetical protein
MDFTYLYETTKKPLAIALNEAGRALKGRDNRSDLTNVQYKLNQNCHSKISPG